MKSKRHKNYIQYIHSYWRKPNMNNTPQNARKTTFKTVVITLNCFIFPIAKRDVPNAIVICSTKELVKVNRPKTTAQGGTFFNQSDNIIGISIIKGIAKKPIYNMRIYILSTRF